MDASALPSSPAPPMPIIVGAPRSGTTLLRFMLDTHPDIAIPPETGFLAIADQIGPIAAADGDLRRAFFDTVTKFPPDAPAWQDFGLDTDAFRTALDAIEPFSVANGYRAFYRLYAARHGKPRWGDKTPLYCRHLTTIARLLPEAHVIHLIRDGRDVALSLRDMWFSPGDEIETLAAYWQDCVATARQQAAGCPHYLEIRFEDLVEDAEAVLQRVCAFIDLPYTASMLDYHARAPVRLAEHRERRRTDGSLLVSHTARVAQQQLTMRPPQSSRVGAWASKMSPEEQHRFSTIAGPLLRELGYPAAN